jgi:hypothetical protein
MVYYHLVPDCGMAIRASLVEVFGHYAMVCMLLLQWQAAVCVLAIWPVAVLSHRSVVEVVQSTVMMLLVLQHMMQPIAVALGRAMAGSIAQRRLRVFDDAHVAEACSIRQVLCMRNLVKKSPHSR